MSQQLIDDAFTADLQRFGQGYDIAWEGRVFRPVTGRPYLVPRLASYTRVAMGFGADSPLEESGAWQVNVVRPADEGRQPAGLTADALVAFYPRGRVLVTSGGQKVILVNASAQPMMSAGGWNTLPVVVSWTATDLPPPSPWRSDAP